MRRKYQTGMNFLLTFFFLLTITACKSESLSSDASVLDLQATQENQQVQEAVNSLLTAVVPTPEEQQQFDLDSENPEPETQNLWISPAVPAAYLSETNILSLTIPANQPENASLSIGPLAINQSLDDGYHTSQWIYVLVAPFPTSIDEVNLDDILLAWQGYPVELFQGKPLMMSDSTKQAFEILWGKQAADSGIKVLDSQTLLDTAWAERPSWAIIPFEEISPRWKVLRVNGLSPLDKSMDPSAYPLKINFAIQGNAEALQALDTGVESGTLSFPSTNRDASKMTDVLLTGVTALVRYTALRMEEQGYDYPALDIVDWMRNADITHISNEVPFDENCPPAIPLRREARFCSDPSYYELFEFAGVDVVELTGNHLLDWGEEPFIDTLDLYKEKGLPYYGGGYNIEDGRKAYLTEVNGNKLAFLGCNAMGPESDWASDTLAGSAPCDMDWMETEIKRLSQEGYLVIVTFQHFEVCEFKPQSTQKIDFERMAKAGAVIVSGSQAHCPQGITFVGDHFIHYGLGNLFFDQMDQYSVREFLDLHVFYNGRYIGTQLYTAMLEDYSQPRPMTADERKLLLDEVFEGSEW